MVDSKRYDPSIKRFQEHTQSFVSGKTKKGHLNNDERTAKDHKKLDGILKRIHKNKIYERGWEVYVDKKKYMCTYGDNIIYLPPYIETSEYYIPKNGKCQVQITVDEKSKIYTITRINDINKQPIELSNKGIILQSKGTGSISVINNIVEAKGEGIILQGEGSSSISVENNVVKTEGEHLLAENDVKIDTTKDKDLPNEISVKNLYRQVQILQEQIDSGKNG